jgi:hypothetical protein
LLRWIATRGERKISPIALPRKEQREEPEFHFIHAARPGLNYEEARKKKRVALLSSSFSLFQFFF